MIYRIRLWLWWAFLSDADRREYNVRLLQAMEAMSLHFRMARASMRDAQQIFAAMGQSARRTMNIDGKV